MIDSFLDALPAHERRRLEAVEGADPEALAQRRVAGEPLQYLEGTAAFLDMDLVIDDRVLVPRPETEGLVELMTSVRSEAQVVVDLGTGSGAIAIALARRYPGAHVHAVDVSAPALEVAAINVARYAPRVVLHHGDLFDALPRGLTGRVDLLVSNPPYVAEGEWPHLPDDVRREPRTALVAGPRGTEALRRIADEAPVWMAPGGVIGCEVGETQTAEVAAMFDRLGQTTVAPDLAGRPRYVVVAQ